MLNDTSTYVNTASASSPFNVADLLAIKAKFDANPVAGVLLLHDALRDQLRRLPKPSSDDAAVLRFTGVAVEFWSDVAALDTLIRSVHRRGKRWMVFGSDGRRLPIFDSAEFYPTPTPEPTP